MSNKLQEEAVISLLILLSISDNELHLKEREFIEKLIREVTFEKRRLKEKFIKNVPIYIKISPDESDKNLFHLINLSEDYGIDGFIVSNIPPANLP